MTIVQLLVVVIGLHVACAFTQLVANYWGGDIVPTDDSLLGNTAIAGTLPAEGDPNEMGVSLTNPVAIVAFVARIGDIVNSGVTFNYGFVEDIRDHGGLVGNVVTFLQLVGFIITVVLGVAIMRLIFDSGVLTSRLAALVLVGGFSFTSVTSIVRDLL